MVSKIGILITDIQLASVDELIDELISRVECLVVSYVTLDAETIVDGTEHVVNRYYGIGYKCIGLVNLLKHRIDAEVCEDYDDD